MLRSEDGDRAELGNAGARTLGKLTPFVIAIVAMLLLICSSLASAADEEEAPSPPPSDDPAVVELKDERTATSQTFLLPDGDRETRLYETPINYQDPQGDWKPIDESFEELDSGRLTNGPNSFDVSLPEHLGADPVRLSIGSVWVTTELLGAEPQAVEPEDATASYDSASGSGVSFEFANLADGLKEEIVIAGPSQPSTFHFDLDASTGLVPTLADDGSIRFRDANGRVVVTLPAPVMSDSADTPAVSRAIHYELGPEVDGHWKLTVEADRDWLTAPERVWPARLDPTMTVGSDLDCIIGGLKGQTGWIDCAAWGRKVDLVNYTPNIDSSKDGWQRGLMYLETSALPANATVSSATFNLYAAEAALNTSGVEVLKTSKPWTWEASWSQYAGPTKLWTTEGGDWSESLKQVLTSQRGSQAGWWQFALPAKTVEGEVAKSADLGVLLKLIDDKTRVCGSESCTQRAVAFSSSAADDTTKRPYLSVVYTVPAAPTIVVKAPTLINGTTATLNAGVNPNGVGATYQFEYGTTTAYGKVAAGYAKYIGLGKTEVAVSEPLSGLSSGTTYHYRIYATNALGKTVSEDKVFSTLKLPTATTEAATAGKPFEATLRGAVNPNGLATTYQFEYGLTTSYGTIVPSSAGSVGSGSSSVAVTRLVTGLTEGSTYHFRIKATSEAGTVFGADKTLATVDVPETTFTSPRPTYTARELSSVTFASDQSGSTFKCALDEGEKPTKTCSSPYAIPSTLKEGWHTLVVAAVNSGGVEDPTPAKYTFNPDIYPPAPTTSKLTAPTEGEESASHYTLQAEWGSAPTGGGVTGVTFQMKLDQWKEFRNVPGECVLDGKGNAVSAWPLPVTENPGRSSPVFFKPAGCSALSSFAKENIKFRAAFDGGANAAGASEPISTDYLTINVNKVGAPTDAIQQIGPANVDLLTGRYTITRTDVSIPVPGTEAILEFARTYGTGYVGSSTVMGNWQPSAPVEQTYSGEAWSSLRERHEDEVKAQYDPECEAEGFTHEECMVEEAIPAADWIELSDSEGATAAFDIQGGSYIAPEYMKEWTLTKQGSGTSATFELVGPEGTHTVFSYNQAVSGTYRPTSVSWQATPKSARMVYELLEGTSVYRLIAMIAPGPVSCPDAEAATKLGCRSLSFEYTKAEKPHLDRLNSITYHGSTGGSLQDEVVARYKYNSYRQLEAVWDPRIPGELAETYTYNTAGPKLLTLTPPGQEPTSFDYVPSGNGWRLKSVSRPSLVSSPATAQTTIVYGVPISGSSAPYEMGPATVATWGQSDYPVNATAIFPPTQVPSETPTDYSHASIIYMDPDGYEVNTASFQKPGASGHSITTTETDRKGNVTRSLSAQNRLLALEAGSNSADRSHQLDTQSIYSTDGTEMLESLGPLHSIRLESGVTEDARAHTVIQYDKEPNGSSIPAPPAGTPWPHLPTKETTSAKTAKGEFDQRTTETRYDWNLRKPTEVIVDPSGLNLRTRTAYDPVTGQVSERSLPANPNGGDARTAKTIYYNTGSGGGRCEGATRVAGLPCEVIPAAQPGTSGQPEVLVTRYKYYNGLDQPVEIVESPGGASTISARYIGITYDSAGRETRRDLSGGGVTVPHIQTTYNSLTGLPEEQKFVCYSNCAGFDDQAVKTTYDKLGRPEKYQDADGNTAETTYDLMGRPATTKDGKGTQTATYDPTTGQMTALQDSAAGTFTATYNADGALRERGLPNGLVAKTSYDEVGAPTHLSYVKTTMCSTNCTWLDFDAEESIYGQVLAQSSTLSSQVYSYDKAGRLILVRDTPTSGACTTREYRFEGEAGKNSNRTKRITRAPGIGGACDTTSAGSAQAYSYDAADRLLATGLSYDDFGRITSLPGAYAGEEKALTTSYFSNDMIASQTQGGITNTFLLDAAGRQRQRTQTGGASGVEVFHYADDSDAPAWTLKGAAWTRNITGIDDELGAIQDSAGGTTLQLADLHGDIVATASLSPSATGLVATFEFDEFGNPKSSSARRYGWLGAKERRTEFASGVIQMGARSYVPAMGRFLSLDPVLGGSANSYDYSYQDPVNVTDLDGRCPACFIGAGLLLRAGVRAASRSAAAAGPRIASTLARGRSVLGRAAAAGVGFVAALGQFASAIGPSLYNIATKTALGAKLFGYGGTLNSNPYLRIGLGRGGGKTAGYEVFRVAAQYKKFGPFKFDLYKGRRLGKRR
jgi:RHS repeat-associated protein